MITGHTHELKLYEENNILYLNPGSLTGARTVVNTGKKEHIPSFMLLDVNQNNIVIYIYKLINDKGNLFVITGTLVLIKMSGNLSNSGSSQ